MRSRPRTEGGRADHGACSSASAARPTIAPPILADRGVIPFPLIHMPFQLIGALSAQSVAVGMAVLLVFASIVRLMLGLFLRGTRKRLSRADRLALDAGAE